MSVPGNSAYPPWPGAAPATPLANARRSGLMSKEDKAALDAATAKLATLARPQLRLNYTAAVDLVAGTAIPAAGALAIGSAQSFSVTGDTSVLLFEVRAAIQVLQSAVDGNALNLRAQVDGASTTGGTKLASAGVSASGAVFLNGAGVFIGQGFAAGAHNFRVLVYAGFAGAAAYCRPATQPETEFLEYRIWEIAP